MYHSSVTENSPENNEFRAALDKARRELSDIDRREKELAQRKAQLLHSVAGLSALCGEMPPISNLSLADAIRAVLQSHRKMNPNSGLKPTEIRDQLRGIGFDLNQFANEMASIGTALKRMKDSGEVELLGDAAFSNIYRWKEQATIPSFSNLAELAAMAGIARQQWEKNVAEKVAVIIGAAKTAVPPKDKK